MVDSENQEINNDEKIDTQHKSRPLLGAICSIALVLGPIIWMHLSDPEAEGIWILYVFLIPILSFLIFSNFMISIPGLVVSAGAIIFLAFILNPLTAILAVAVMLIYTAAANYVVIFLFTPEFIGKTDEEVTKILEAQKKQREELAEKKQLEEQQEK